MNITFTEKEKEEIKKFHSIHKDCCTKHLGKSFFSTTGGQYSFLITPTGLGDIVEVRCNACGEIEDITDNNWLDCQFILQKYGF